MPQEPRITLTAEMTAAARGSGLLLVLTGAGISAESGIPTFRGPEGYWREGSRNYHPMELATCAAFDRVPEHVWAWYLYRRAVCLAAQPNAAHHALVDMEQTLGDRFLLLTQNVDGLHRRAGNSAARTYEIHGNIAWMRCAAACGAPKVAIPSSFDGWTRERRLQHDELRLLRCSRCGAWQRPHVLWFDEFYDEPNFKFQSSQEAARRASLLVVIGTSGATNLPMRVADIAAQRGVPIAVIDPEPSPFSELAAEVPGGLFLRGRAGELLPPLVEALLAAARRA